MGKHTSISASNIQRVVKCPASVRAAEQVEKFDTEFSSEGTVAHDLAAKVITTWGISKELPEGDFDFDRLQHASEYLTYSQSVWQDKSVVHVEIKVELEEMVRGTADQIVVSPDRIDVIDYKYGEGVLVSAHNNYQLAFYALGARRKFGRKDIYGLHIFQPRVSQVWEEKFSVWEVEDHELDLFEELFFKTIEDVRNGEVHFRKGDHCGFCPAKPRCPEWGNALLEVQAARASVPAPEMLSEQQASFIQRHGDDICTWIRAVQKYNLQKALNGDVLPEHKLIEGRSYRKWEESMEPEIAERLESLGVDPWSKALLPFSKAEKLLGKKRFESEFGQYLVKPRGKPKLVHQSERGEPIQSGSEFSGLDIFGVDDVEVD